MAILVPLYVQVCPFRHVLCRPEPGKSQRRDRSVLRHEHERDMRHAKTQQRTSKTVQLCYILVENY